MPYRLVALQPPLPLGAAAVARDLALTRALLTLTVKITEVKKNAVGRKPTLAETSLTPLFAVLAVANPYMVAVVVVTRVTLTAEAKVLKLRALWPVELAVLPAMSEELGWVSGSVSMGICIYTCVVSVLMQCRSNLAR